MNDEQTIVRVDATGRLRISEGDRIRRGDALSDACAADSGTAPVSGLVKSIRFDPNAHEFVIVIARTA
jgi:Na+-translocating ferredoxin:NAD+ oxidoreductase RnfC subunit